MRARKVLNLYPDEEPAHAELLDYLEGIEGERRRQQALLQMALIGFRVMVKHESGEEAHFRARNPDLNKLLGEGSRGLITGVTPVERKIRPRKTEIIEGRASVVTQPPAEPVKAPTSVQTPVRAQEIRVEKPVYSAPAQPIQQQEQREEEAMQDPLALLRQLSEGD